MYYFYPFEPKRLDCRNKITVIAYENRDIVVCMCKHFNDYLCVYSLFNKSRKLLLTTWAFIYYCMAIVTS